MKKNALTYSLIIGMFACATWFVLDRGEQLTTAHQQLYATGITENPAAEKTSPGNINPHETVWQQFIYNTKSPLGLLLLQIIVILFVSKLFGLLFKRVGQQTVVGEMIAGIFLGPSVMGLLFPSFSQFLFPASSLPNLQFLSQVGLIFFMFIIGMELEVENLKNKAHSAVVISHASIAFPYFLGVLVSYFLYRQFAPAAVTFSAFALFMGIALSITAFPVLARILQERKLTKTPLGAMVLTCAATDDVTAWCILAAVVAIVKAGSIISALFTIALALIFVLLMLYVVRPAVKKLSLKYQAQNFNKTLLVIIFLSCYLLPVLLK